MNKDLLRIILIRQEHFCASHLLYNPEKSKEWNNAIYGKCSRENGHGHNYTMEVYVEGSPDPETGMIINITKMKEIMDEVILKKVDHYHLNYDVDFLQGIIPTTENVAIAFWEQLDPHFPNNSLQRIRLWETEKNIAEVVRKK